MGEHDSWYTLLMPEFWARLEASAAEHLARDKAFLIFGATHFTLVHVAGAVLAFVFIIIAALRYRFSLKDPSRGVIPPRNFGLAAMVDGFVGVVYDLSVDVMGEDDARRFLPLSGTLALFIFVCNIQGLVPGLMPPTDTLKTNLVFALLVFLVYNVVGVVRNGFGYFAHFLGPKIGGFPWLFPLLLPVELIHHLSRPVSLSLRLTGNLVADHKVVGLVALMVPLLVPLPFLLLGAVVAIVQTLVFTLLSIIFIGLAARHADEH